MGKGQDSSNQGAGPFYGDRPEGIEGIPGQEGIQKEKGDKRLMMEKEEPRPSTGEVLTGAHCRGPGRWVVSPRSAGIFFISWQASQCQRLFRFNFRGAPARGARGKVH